MKYIIGIALIMGALGFYAWDDELLNVADITCKTTRTPMIGYPIKSCKLEFNDKGFFARLFD